MSDVSLTSEILSDLEKEKVALFCADETMYNAVKKVLMAGVYSMGVQKPGVEHDPTRNAALTQAFQAVMHGLPITDEELGQNVRAQASGLRSIEVGFSELDKVQPIVGKEDDKPKENPAL